MTKSSNGRAARRVAKKAATEAPTERIALSDAQKQQLGAIDAEMARMKLALANARIAQEDAEREQKRLLRELTQRRQLFKDTIDNIAENYGIDPDGTETWRLDLSQMQLYRA